MEVLILDDLGGKGASMALKDPQSSKNHLGLQGINWGPHRLADEANLSGLHRTSSSATWSPNRSAQQAAHRPDRPAGHVSDTHAIGTWRYTSWVHEPTTWLRVRTNLLLHC